MNVLFQVGDLIMLSSSTRKESLNKVGEHFATMYHLRRIGPPATKEGVPDIME